MTQHFPQPLPTSWTQLKLYMLSEKQLGSASSLSLGIHHSNTLAFTDVPEFGQSQFSHLHPELTRRPAWAGALPKQRRLLLL